MHVVAKNINDRSGVVTVEGETQVEVQGPAARQLAIKTAASNGLSKPGLSGNDTAYPIDAAGKLIEGAGDVAAYRCDFNVTGMI